MSQARRLGAKMALKITAGVLITLVVGAAAGVWIVTRMSAGQEWMLEQALQRVEGSINGEIVVSGLRSGGLHRGARLLGVRVTDASGGQLLEVDSVEAEYSVRGMLTGRVSLTGLTLWRPRLTITKDAPDEPFNLEAFLDAGGSSSTEAGDAESSSIELGDVDELSDAGVRFVFDDVEIRDGSVDVRYPLTSPDDPSSRFLSEPGPPGTGRMRVFGFDGIDGHVEGEIAPDPSVDGLRMDVSDLRFVGRVFDDPVQVEGLSGNVAWSGETISATVETMGVLGATAGGSGVVEFGDGGVATLSFDADVQSLDLLELRWLEPRLPDARASGQIDAQYGSDGFRGTWSDGTLAIGGGRIEARGTLTRPVSGDAGFEDVELDISAVSASALQDFVSFDVPLEGRLSGDVDLSGSLDALTVTGRMDLVEPGAGVTSGEFDGVLHLLPPVGATGLTARVTALDLGLFNRVGEGLPLDGLVDLDIQADGSMNTGIRVAVEGTFPGPAAEPSRVFLGGLVFDADGEIEVGLDGELNPLSIADIFEEGSSPSRLGIARGTIHANGALSDLVLRGDLVTESGRLTIESRFDLRSPAESYRIRGEAFEYDVLELVPEAPDGTILSGGFDLFGQGGDLRTAELAGGLNLGASRFAELTIDTTSVGFQVSDGIITIDDLQGRIGGVTVSGGGTLAMEGAGPTEEIRLDLETDNLAGLRPLLLGADVIAGDTLTALERQILEFEGIDVDTLPTLSEVLVAGQMTGELVIGGSLERLSAVGRFEVQDGFYEGDRVGQAEVSFSATGLFAPDRALSALIDAGSINVFEREFDSLSARFEYGDAGGNGDVYVVRSPDETYQGRLAFEEDGDVRTIHLDELVFRFPEERWNLAGPSTITWDPNGLTFRDFRLRRPGLGGVRLQAQGRLPFEGEADFRLDAEALDVRRIARVLQLDEVLEGVVDLDLRLSGTDAEPVMDLTLAADDFRFREYVLDRLEADVRYADLTASGDAAVLNESLQVLTVAGELPLNLSFNAVEERLPEEAIDLVVVSDQLPLSLLLAPFPGYQEVVGTMSGRVEVGGTSRSLAPRGQLTIDDGGAFLSGLGVRQEEIRGTLNWFPDGRLEVDVGASALGTTRVQGTVALTTLLDPGFDLDVSFDGFQAIERRDATGIVTGNILLAGSYSRPVLSGDLFVDEGTLFFDEFQRVAEVTDLFFERAAGAADLPVSDTTRVGLAAFFAGESPFLQNIRMENLTLTAQRDAWIRSEQMNLELEGTLDLLYDRQSQDLALVGALQAVRGSLAFGPRGLRKDFQVDEGTLRFLGTPGINPDLDITASEPVRTPEGDRLTIIASVTGTLVSPRVALTSDEAGFSEDDLLSYLWFGRPSYALTSGQAEAVGAAGAVGLNFFTSEIGAAMTQGLGLDFLDYLSITQQDLGAVGEIGSSERRTALGTTVIETGMYVADDMFLTLLFRPPSAQRSGTDNWPGIRFEWTASRGYTLQSYFEDEFFRGRSVGFGELGVQSRKGLGLSIFRDWGY